MPIGNIDILQSNLLLHLRYITIRNVHLYVDSMNVSKSKTLPISIEISHHINGIIQFLICYEYISSIDALFYVNIDGFSAQVS